MERRFVNNERAEIRMERDGSGEPTKIIGYGAVFYDAEDRSGTEYQLGPDMAERIMPGAFDRALSEGDDTRGLFNHDPDNLLGRTANGTMRMQADSVGLRYEIDYDPQDPDHQRVMRKIERGDLSGSSFAFVVEAAEWSEEGGQDIRQVRSVRMFDTGPVTYPAYEGTSTDVRAMGNIQEIRSERDAWKKSKQKVKEMQKILDKPIPSR